MPRVLDERVPFLEGAALEAGRARVCTSSPTSADEAATLFEHCARGLDLSLATGAHGLPLIGTGDWNDGMNRVGEGGQGRERLAGLVPACARSAPSRRSPPRAARRSARRCLDSRMPMRWRRALDREGWDGDWYRRGYFDDGTPLGSASSEECRINSIAQSWAVISGAGDPARAAQAMAAVDRLLVHRGDRLALLFTPPFDKTALDPGYIKGYPPGIRENGGQYTHAAAWSIMALCDARPRRQGWRAVLAAQSDQPRRHARRRAALQGRALRRRRRRLLGGAACRARRLDLVHRLGRLAVPRRHRVRSWASRPGRTRSSSRPAFPRHGRAST